MTRSHLVWTRSLSDWKKDQTLLTRLVPLTVSVLHLPCLSLQRVACEPAQAAYDVVVCTSANGAKFAWQDACTQAVMRQAPRRLTHGAATAAAMAALGLPAEQVQTATTGSELAAWMQEHVSTHSRILLLSAREPAFPLAAALRQTGHQIDELICYETEVRLTTATGGELAEQDRQQLVTTLSGVVCFASPSAVQGFVAALTPSNNQLGHSLVAVAIGPTTAAAATKDFAAVRTASAPKVETLVATALLALRDFGLPRV